MSLEHGTASGRGFVQVSVRRHQTGSVERWSFAIVICQRGQKSWICDSQVGHNEALQTVFSSKRQPHSKRTNNTGNARFRET